METSIIKTDNGNYLQNTVNFSRNLEEQAFVVSGKKSYTNLGGLIAYNLGTIDKCAEGLGDFVGKLATAKVYDKQYFEPRYGKFKNFLTRNIIIDPAKKIKYQMGRELTYDAARLITESLIKYGSAYIANAYNEKSAFDLYSNIYNYLYIFANDGVCANDGFVKLELNKIRSSFDLSNKDKTKIHSIAAAQSAKNVDAIDLQMLLGLDEEVKMNISYFLYCIAAVKYDDPAELEKNLKLYNRYLGFSGSDSYMTTLIQVSKEAYDDILKDQHLMNTIASQMVQKLFINIPHIDIDSIVARGKEISAYDPYALRRKKNRNFISDKASEVAKTAKTITLAMLASEYPQLAVLASSEALSQLNIKNDNVLEEGMKLVENSIGDNSTMNGIENTAKAISNAAEEYK